MLVASKRRIGAAPITLYRAIHHNPPTVEDFYSHERLGRRPPSDDPGLLRRWSGVSMMDSVAAIRRRAGAARRFDSFIATVVLSDEDAAVVEQTGGSHHYDVWAEPALLLARVVAVESVEQRQ